MGDDDFVPHTIVFHPGIGKTATSTIQAFGLSLPTNDPHRTCFSPFGILGGAHNGFASVHPMFDAQLRKSAINDLILFALKRIAPTVVSSEFLMRDRPESIEELVSKCRDAGLPVKVIFGIREYQGFLISAYMQAIKVKWGMKDNETLAEYAARELPLMRYPALIEQWARPAGNANIVLIDFDRNREHFLRLFFDFLRLPTAKPEQIAKSNPSLHVATAAIIRQFDLVCDDASARQGLVKHLMGLNYKAGTVEESRRIVSAVTGHQYQEDCQLLSLNYRWLGKHF